MTNSRKKNSQTISLNTAQLELTRKLATEQIALAREMVALIAELKKTLREGQRYAALVAKPVLVQVKKTQQKVIPYPAHLVERPSKATLGGD